jgi:hypothetical protein
MTRDEERRARARDLTLALAGAVLLVPAAPPSDLWPLALVGWVPLALLAARGDVRLMRRSATVGPRPDSVPNHRLDSTRTPIRPETKLQSALRDLGADSGSVPRIRPLPP